MEKICKVLFFSTSTVSKFTFWYRHIEQHYLKSCHICNREDDDDVTCPLPCDCPPPPSAQTPLHTLAVVTGRRGFVVGFKSTVAARAPPPIPGPASLPQRLVLLVVRHLTLATRSTATDVHNTVTTSCNTMTEDQKKKRRMAERDWLHSRVTNLLEVL